ncbi:MAG: MFS transporter [Promethearchaeota archaeon]
MDRKWQVLAVCAGSVFVTAFDVASLNVLLPRIAADLGASYEAVQWASIANLVVMGTTLLLFGRLADARGREGPYLAGLVAFALACLLGAASWGGAALVFAKAIQGLGNSLISATSVAMITAAFPARERGRVLGINVATIYAGLSLGPLLGGVLAADWRWVMAVEALAIGALTPVAWAALSPPAGVSCKGGASPAGPEAGPPADPAAGAPTRWQDARGTTAFGLALAGLLLGVTMGRRLGWGSPFTLVALVVAAGSGLAFARVESSAARAGKAVLVDFSAFRGNQPLSSATLKAFVAYVATNGVNLLTSIYLQSLLGLSGSQAGLLLAPMPVIMAITSPLSGRLSDRLGSRAPTTLGLAFMAAGLGTLSLVPAGLPVAVVPAAQVLTGCGFGCFSSPNQSTIMGSVDRKLYGFASGWISTIRVVGQAISVAVLGAVVAAFVDPAALSTILANPAAPVDPAALAAFERGFQVALWSSATALVAAAAFSGLTGRDAARRGGERG